MFVGEKKFAMKSSMPFFINTVVPVVDNVRNFDSIAFIKCPMRAIVEKLMFFQSEAHGSAVSSRLARTVS